MPRFTVSELIQSFQLMPHPEGGFFRETYRSPGVVHDRSFSTAIYFLLPAGSKSALHRIASDEVWHFYLGDPMTLTQIHPDGRCETVVLGQDLSRGHRLQHVVPAGCWFGGMPAEGSEYSFVGCTVAPGFDFRDFELARREALLRQFPHLRAEILQLTD